MKSTSKHGGVTTYLGEFDGEVSLQDVLCASPLLSCCGDLVLEDRSDTSVSFCRHDP